jgi:hypothetical protein
MKRLKRGLPLDEGPDHDRGFSAASSPLVSASSMLPPAKKHQLGPPAPPDTMYHHRQPANGALPMVTLTCGPPPHPQHQFYQSNQPLPYQVPYGPSYSHGGPPSHSTQGPSSASLVAPLRAIGGNPAPPAPNTHMQREVNSSTLNGHTSATVTPSQPSQPSQPQHPPSMRSVNQNDALNHHPHPSSTPSGFSSVSQSPTSNPSSDSAKEPASKYRNCERVDLLNRGIWTSYGPSGAVEMYLLCHINGCMRMDWRNCHALERHIIKRHGMQDGMIGDLQKVLDHFGVPVREIEAHEKEHGLGTGGTKWGNKGTLSFITRFSRKPKFRKPTNHENFGHLECNWCAVDKRSASEPTVSILPIQQARPTTASRVVSA